MKKTLIALAVAGFSFNAAAAPIADTTVALTGGDAVLFPNEAVVKFVGDANGATAIAATNQLKVTTTAKVGLDTSFIRIDLGNGAKFAGNPTATGYSFAAGGQGKDFVVLTSVGAVEQGDAVDVVFDDGINVASKGPVSVKYTQYETPQAASNATGALDTKEAVLLNFVDALTVTAKAANQDSFIDVASAEKKFADKDGNNVTVDANLLTVDIDGNNAVLKLTGETFNDEAAVVTDILGTVGTASWEVAGSFGFVADTNGVVVEGTTDVTGNDKNKVSFTLGQTGADYATTVALKATGDDIIPAAGYSVTLKQGTDGTNPISAYKLSDAQSTFSTVATLKKNGAQADIDLALSPNSSFEHYVRITNDSSKDGKVFVRVFNDQGVFADLTLADLGQVESVAAGHTAQPVSIKKIYEAAKLKNSTLASDYVGMLRLEITSELPSIDVQSYSVSTDANANSFNVFN